MVQVADDNRDRISQCGAGRECCREPRVTKTGWSHKFKAIVDILCGLFTLALVKKKVQNNDKNSKFNVLDINSSWAFEQVWFREGVSELSRPRSTSVEFLSYDPRPFTSLKATYITVSISCEPCNLVEDDSAENVHTVWSCSAYRFRSLCHAAGSYVTQEGK